MVPTHTATRCSTPHARLEAATGCGGGSSGAARGNMSAIAALASAALAAQRDFGRCWAAIAASVSVPKCSNVTVHQPELVDDRLSCHVQPRRVVSRQRLQPAWSTGWLVHGKAPVVWRTSWLVSYRLPKKPSPSRDGSRASFRAKRGGRYQPLTTCYQA